MLIPQQTGSSIDTIDLNSAASTDPNNPLTLGNDIWQYDTFSEGSDYYYNTTSMSPDYYYLIWLRTVNSSENYNLYVYEQSDYTSELESSISSQYMDWIVYRPSTPNTYLYPKIDAYSGNGSGYIEAESADNITTIGPTHYAVDTNTNDYGDIKQVYLENGTKYTLTMYHGRWDYYIYIYYLGSGESGNNLEYAASTFSAITSQTSISFVPTYSDYYAIVTINKYNVIGLDPEISIDYWTPSLPPVIIPGFEIIPILMGLFFVITLVYSFKKSRRNTLA